MKHTAIYLRVSGNKQKFDSQEPDLTRWIEVNNAENVQWYRDKFTGKSMARPGMDRLIADLYAGKLDRIVCWRLDRLGRTAAGLTRLFEELRQYDCNLISLKDSLDLSTPAGRLNANIIASVAAYETEVRGERVKAGQEAARDKGRKWGGSRKGVRKKKVAEKAKTVLLLAEQGVAKMQIAKVLGISVPTVYSILGERG